MRLAIGISAAAMGGLVLLGAPTPASACGGTFCDGGPQPMPVDQTGENIVFVLGDGYVEAHIQIQYDEEAAAERFAWVVPVTDTPGLEIGSQNFFTALLGATAPRYAFGTWFEPCGEGPSDDDFDNCDDGDDPWGGGEKFDVGSGPSDEPEVVKREVVGAFEMFVLEGGTAQGVMQWLGDNGFDQDPAAEPILGEYIEDGFSFVAFRLAPGAGAGEIHPIVLRIPGDEACVPIRLTRIAAVEDMTIRTFFLSDHRVVPANFEHVEINPLRLDWTAQADNYGDVVSMAVDEAGGRAFVTEYAAASETVPVGSLPEADWDKWWFFGLRGQEIAEAIETLGWMQCDFDGCASTVPLVPSLLDEFFELDGVSYEEFWSCPSCFPEAVDEEAFDAKAFVTALENRVILPARHAATLLAEYPTLTRMTTSMSPQEMIEDPLFHQNPDLPEVLLQAPTGTRNSFCDGEQSFSLPSGELVALPGDLQWPSFGKPMPWALRVEEIADAGAPIVVQDNADAIAEALASYNESQGGARVPTSPACDDDDDDDGGPGPVPPGLDDAGQDGDGMDARDLGGCGCRSTAAAWPASLLGLFLLGVARRRRR